MTGWKFKLRKNLIGNGKKGEKNTETGAWKTKIRRSEYGDRSTETGKGSWWYRLEGFHKS
jgi:hypothetical protein